MHIGAGRVSEGRRARYGRLRDIRRPMHQHVVREGVRGGSGYREGGVPSARRRRTNQREPSEPQVSGVDSQRTPTHTRQGK